MAENARRRNRASALSRMGQSLSGFAERKQRRDILRAENSRADEALRLRGGELGVSQQNADTSRMNAETNRMNSEFAMRQAEEQKLFQLTQGGNLGVLKNMLSLHYGGEAKIPAQVIRTAESIAGMPDETSQRQMLTQLWRMVTPDEDFRPSALAEKLAFASDEFYSERGQGVFEMGAAQIQAEFGDKKFWPGDQSRGPEDKDFEEKLFEAIEEVFFNEETGYFRDLDASQLRNIIFDKMRTGDFLASTPVPGVNAPGTTSAQDALNNARSGNWTQ